MNQRPGLAACFPGFVETMGLTSLAVAIPRCPIAESI